MVEQKAFNVDPLRLSLSIIMKSFCLVVLAFGLASAVPTVDKQALKEIAAKGRTTVLLNFKGAGSAEVRAAFHEEHRPMERSVHPDVFPNMLKDNADKVQAKTLEFFAARKQAKASGSTADQLWITNQIVVRDADMELIEELLKNEDISHIEADREYQLIEGVMDRAEEQTTDSPHAWETTDEPHLIDAQQDDEKAEWGVKAVNATRVWNVAKFNGTGVTVGVIDTGVHRTHECLRGNMRPTHNFYDAAPHPFWGPKVEAYDDQGHGTHCAGTILGTKGVGVAPGAQWIACKGLNFMGSGSTSGLVKCGEFMLCPWQGRDENTRNCSMAPKVISNSWGSTQTNNFYKEVVANWRANGQVVIFANGNDGRNGCNTTGSPADYPEVIAVGATDINGKITDFSSRGSAKNGTVKPDVSAPGRDINSASHRSDTGYTKMSGTSMAAPHVSGVAALYISAYPHLKHEQVQQYLQQGASLTVPSTKESCGPKGREVDETRRPNNHAGWGLVDAAKAFNATNPTRQ